MTSLAQPAGSNLPWFRGSGDSMAPLIPEACLLTVVACPPSEILAGDVIVYNGRGRYICHRVVLREVRQNQFWYYVLGNDPTRADGWIPETLVEGRVDEVDSKKIPGWKRKLFYWHGLFEVAFIYKVMQSSFSKKLSWELAKRFRYRPKTATKLFLVLSALAWPSLLRIRCRRYL